uniref:Uncharacterized protein n=1 Tax=Anguilla anguilla TaxID=7936 RepID=A0A0E9S193_ANGAN
MDIFLTFSLLLL